MEERHRDTPSGFFQLGTLGSTGSQRCSTPQDPPTRLSLLTGATTPRQPLGTHRSWGGRWVGVPGSPRYSRTLGAGGRLAESKGRKKAAFVWGLRTSLGSGGEFAAF